MTLCHCGKLGVVGYLEHADAPLIWCCSRHQISQWYADTRRDRSTRSPAFARIEPRANPPSMRQRPPDPQAPLVQRFRRYDLATSQAWAKWEQAYEEFRAIAVGAIVPLR
jgi:hypothetical protein